jgi:hypothetical protein
MLSEAPLRKVLGIGIILVGLIGSTMYVRDVKKELPNKPGASFSVSNYKLVFKGLDQRQLPNQDVVANATFDVQRNGKSVGTSNPGLLQFAIQGQTRLNADVHVEPLRDVFVIFEGTTTLDRKARAETESASRRLTMVPPFDHPWIIAGQGTVGLEICEQLPDVATVYVQVGGGGLISGIAAAVKRVKPAVRVIGVEPDGAPKMSASLAAGEPVTLPATRSVADGLLAVRPGELTFAHVQALVDEVVRVDDAATLDALRWLFREAKLVVEPSGAITVAAAMAGAGAPGPGPAVAVLSGGNVEPEAFANYLTAKS